MLIKITDDMIKELGKCRFDKTNQRFVHYLMGHVLYEDRKNNWASRPKLGNPDLCKNPFAWNDHAKEQAIVRLIKTSAAEACLQQGFQTHTRNKYTWSRFLGDLEVGAGWDRHDENKINIISAYRYTQAHNPGILKRLLGYLQKWIHPACQGCLWNMTEIGKVTLDWQPRGLRYFNRLAHLQNFLQGCEGVEEVTQELLKEAYEAVRRTKLDESCKQHTQQLADGVGFQHPNNVYDDWILVVILPPEEQWTPARQEMLELIGFQKETHMGANKRQFNIDLRKMPKSFLT